MTSSNVFVWIEYRKKLIPEEVEDWIISQLNEPNSNVVEKNQSYFLRINATFSSSYENNYFFPVFTAGWQNLSYRIYLEINCNEKTGLSPLHDSPRIHQKIDNYDLALLIPRDTCIINNCYFRLIRDDWIPLPTFEVILRFEPKIR